MRIQTDEWGVVSRVAELVGLKRTTLIYAIERGEVRVAELVGGTQIVQVASAQRYADREYTTGRPRQ